MIGTPFLMRRQEHTRQPGDDKSYQTQAYRYPFAVIDKASGIFAGVCPLGLDRVFEAIRAGRGTTPTTMFCLVWWAAEKEAYAILRQHLALRRQFSEIEVVILCNSSVEEKILRALRIPVILCNHNSFINPAFFRPQWEVTRWTAIYNAALVPYKRFELAQAISSLAIITHVWSEHAEARAHAEYARWIRKLLPQASWINYRLDGSFRWLAPPEVAGFLNTCRVGLCLSRVEGAMYASFEYLLAGLPVVSTPSIGGRDVFFDPEFSEIVDPEPRALAVAVDRWALRSPPRSEIRARALTMREQHLDRFAMALDDCLRRRANCDSGGRCAADIIPQLPNRLVAWRTATEITAASRGG
jgi:hypothetical protein